jgi:membrane peptidoglycan carboxypeptidase
LPPAKDWRERFQRFFTRDNWRRNRRWLVLLPVVPFLILTVLFCRVVIGFESPQQLILATKGVEILDRNGEPLFTFDAGEPGSGRITPLADVPKSVIDATVATEDAHFWSTPGGLNPKGIARATYENLAFWEHGGFFKGSGGSGITQQLAKNLYIAPEDRASRNPARKITEAMYAFELDRRYDKEQIMSWYLSQVNYGHGAYGIEAAAFRYFSKPPKDLTLAESALLAGLPKAPATYDPLKYPERALERQKQVLGLMVRHGYLDQATADKAAATPLALKEGRAPSETQQAEPLAPHFAAYVYELLPQLLGKNAGGHLKVQTTLDAELQRQAETILKNRLDAFEKQVGATNGAIVAIDPATGEILAMAGSHDFYRTDISGQVNNALSLNEPGSTMKGITYLAAMMKGWNPSTIVKDEPFKMSNGSEESYTLGNADKRYRGDVSVRTALGSSLNVPAVKALEYAGLPQVHALAAKMGVTSLKEISNYGPAFTLGGVDVSLLDMTYAYSVLAAYGEQAGVEHNQSGLLNAKGQRPLDPVAVLSVARDNGQLVYRAKGHKERIVPANATYLVTHILADDNARVSMFGANSAMNLSGRPSAVKTGSSDDTRDLWAIGYTTQLVTGVWVGNADNKPMGGTSSLVAAPIWRDFMNAALKGKPVAQFPVPGGIEFAKVCASTGGPPSNSCRVVTEPFLSGRLPQGVKAEKQESQGQPAVSQPRQNPTPPPPQAQQPPAQPTPGFGAGLAATPQAPQQPQPPTVLPGPPVVTQPPVFPTPARPPGQQPPQPTVVIPTPVTAPSGPRIPGGPAPGNTPTSRTNPGPF